VKPSPTRRDPPRLVILAVLARPLYVLILAVSVWVLLRGHNEPGGGFIGGLLAVSATVLWAVAHGCADAQARLPLRDPVRLAALGAGLAALSGLPALLDGQAYLTHWWGSLDLWVTSFKVSTVMLFDLGVYLCVWGGLAGYALGLLGLEESP
jgi:multicomponent Na+:H+ antiporter subunit B